MFENQPATGQGDGPRFIYRLAGLTMAMGMAFAAWPLIDSMNPSAEALTPVVSVDLEAIPPGQRKTVYWRQGIPVFVVHRTPEQIAQVRADDHADMKFPQPDRERVQRDEWLVVINTCIQLFGQKRGERTGRWGGWYCPFHDAEYDLSGRLRSRYGERNFRVPPYYFQGDRWLVIGDRP